MDIIVDIDGTVADAEHRKHFITSKPKNYDKFYAHAKHDTVIEDVAIIVRTLMQAGDQIVFCTGRPEKLREATIRWLRAARLTEIKGRAPVIYMRGDKDYRPDTVVKAELYEIMLKDGYTPTVAVDDRPRVCKMWKGLGLTVLRVNEHDDF